MTNPFKSANPASKQIADIAMSYSINYDYLEATLPDGREKALALTNLQQSYLWSIQAIQSQLQ